MSAFDAIVLAGGRARRLGGVDKPLEMVGGQPLLEHVLAAVADARRTVVVGPRREIVGADALLWTREQPVGSGPARAVAAGAQHVSADVVLILAADMPFIAPAIGPLRRALDAERDADVAMLRAEGRDNYLAAAWRRTALGEALAARPPQPGDSARLLYRDARVAVVQDAGGWSRDCDTWDDLARARSDAPPEEGRPT